MRFHGFVLGTLSVWRITHLLFVEDGPWEMVVELRRRAGAGFWGQLFDCFYCLSLWISAPFAILLGKGPGDWVLLWPALSAGAIMIERVTNRMLGETPAAIFIEDEEDKNGMLR